MSRPNESKRLVWPWFLVAVMALIFIGVMATIIGTVASNYWGMAQYVSYLESGYQYPTFIDPEDLIFA